MKNYVADQGRDLTGDDEGYMLNYLLLHTVQVIPLVAFWSLIYFGRHDLQLRTIMLFVVIWLLSLLSVSVMHSPSGVFPAIEAILSIVLVLLVFGGDFKIR